MSVKLLRVYTGGTRKALVDADTDKIIVFDTDTFVTPVLVGFNGGFKVGTTNPTSLQMAAGNANYVQYSGSVDLGYYGGVHRTLSVYWKLTVSSGVPKWVGEFTWYQGISAAMNVTAELELSGDDWSIYGTYSVTVTYINSTDMTATTAVSVSEAP